MVIILMASASTAPKQLFFCLGITASSGDAIQRLMSTLGKPSRTIDFFRCWSLSEVALAAAAADFAILVLDPNEPLIVLQRKKFIHRALPW